GTHGDEVFIAMELVDGPSLKQWLLQPRSRREIVDVMRQAGRGLAALHAAGVIHRDFKPGNVLVGKDGRVRVMDFGLARRANEPPPTDDSFPSSRDALGEDLTITGTLMGTPLFMPPEAYRGEL